MDEPMKSHQEGHAAGKRVLVVDDSADSIEMMALILEQEGYEVETAYDGPEALEVAKSRLPDIVLLDVTLPTLDGIEVATELRLTAGLEDALIVAVTGHGHDELPEPSPFDHHLMKPVDMDGLVGLLSMGGKPTKPRPPSGNLTPMSARP
jgi:CheY-like chemotaxis protein